MVEGKIIVIISTYVLFFDDRCRSEYNSIDLVDHTESLSQIFFEYLANLFFSFEFANK